MRGSKRQLANHAIDSESSPDGNKILELVANCH
jgi:hypothetical protein